MGWDTPEVSLKFILFIVEQKKIEIISDVMNKES